MHPNRVVCAQVPPYREGCCAQDRDQSAFVAYAQEWTVSPFGSHISAIVAFKCSMLAYDSDLDSSANPYVPAL